MKCVLKRINMEFLLELFEAIVEVFCWPDFGSSNKKRD